MLANRQIRQGLKVSGRLNRRLAASTNGNGRSASNGNGRHNGNGKHTTNGHAGNGNGKPKKPCAAEVELTVQRWEESKAAAKALYAEADALEQQIILSLGVGGSLSLSDGRRLAVDDNFLDKTGAVKIKAYSVCGVKRFEVSVK